MPRDGAENDEPSSQDVKRPQKVLIGLYTSHMLSMWNSRAFEFGAVIFLAAIFPGTLFYTSCYALIRSLSAFLLSTWAGHCVDRYNRLFVVKNSIVWQRVPVALSSLLFYFMLRAPLSPLTKYLYFPATAALACVEKLAAVANTVAVERDWLIIISESLNLQRHNLNASIRRIDLFCKLVAPVFISIVEGYSTFTAIWTVVILTTISVVIEYFAIARVYYLVPELSLSKAAEHSPSVEDGVKLSTLGETDVSQARTHSSRFSELLWKFVLPWKEYLWSETFLASFALSLLYLTVLSFGVQMITYLLSIGYTSLQIVSVRIVSVILELLATWITPLLMGKIGPVRSGLWSINWQLLSIVTATVLFGQYSENAAVAGVSLIIGVTLSRLGLWGFDLSVQYVVQDDIPESRRGSFSASEAALQNFFELLSFTSTAIFARPESFRYPVFLSCGATVLSTICFTAFVKRRRGHLLHPSQCLSGFKYAKVQDMELQEIEDSPIPA